MIQSTLIGAGIALVALWIALAAPVSVGELVRVVLASLRLARALYRESTLPGLVRWRLRIAVRIAGGGAVGPHWSGSPESLAVLDRVLRLHGPDV